jgi:hypothetical protein
MSWRNYKNLTEYIVWFMVYGHNGMHMNFEFDSSGKEFGNFLDICLKELMETAKRYYSH